MRSLHFITMLAVVLSIFVATNNQANNLKREDPVSDKMPKFAYYTLKGEKFTNKDLDANKHYLFVYFNPMCDLCRDEIEDIVENIDYLSNVQIVMVSPSHKKEIEQFEAYYKLADYPEITILHDSQDEFYLEFGAIGYPNLYVYDENQKLVKYFDHATGFNKIKNVLKPVLTKN